MPRRRKEERRHVDRYNLRAREKSLTVGEYVLILQKDTTASKVFSKWIGPAVVTCDRGSVSSFICR